MDYNATAWTNITLASGWSGVSLAYRIKDGMCIFRGEFYGGVDQTTVFTLPTEATPPVRLSVPVTRYATGSVPPYGSVAISTTGATTFLLLGGTIPAVSPGFSMGAVTYPVE